MRSLTVAMRYALATAKERGFVVAGADAIGGKIVRTSAATLQALERRGLLKLSISPAGGMMGRPV